MIAYDGRLPALLAAVRRTRYERVIDLHATLRSRLVARAAARGARHLTIDKRSRERRALLHGVAPSARLVGGVVGWGAERLGRPPRAPRLHVGEAAAAAARALLAQHGVARGFVAVAPGARRATKAWPPPRVAELLHLLAGDGALRGRGALLVGGAGDEPLLRRLAAEARAPFVVPDLTILPALLAEAAVAVTGDSAPLHVAESVGTPVVALFGPTVAGFGFAPRRVDSVRLEVDLSCRPCSLHGDVACPLGHHLCMALIEPSRVLDAVRAVAGSDRADAARTDGRALSA